MSASVGVDILGDPAAPQPQRALDAVRREFRSSRRSSSGERWGAGRLAEQLPRLALPNALEVLLGWRGEARFDAGAVAWHARLAGHAPRLTLNDAGHALAALRELGGPCPETAAYALRALCVRYRLDDVAAVLDKWVAQRQADGGL